MMPARTNRYVKDGNSFAIELYFPHKNEIEDFAYISEEDLDVAKTVFWKKTEYGYARGFSKALNRDVLLHKLVTGTDGGTIIDHINRNKLDCRRENLRIANKSINSLNRNAPSNSSTGVAGVSFDRRRKLYRAYGKLNGKHIFLGYHKKIEDAIIARRKFEDKVMCPLLSELKERVPVIFDDIGVESDE